MLVFLFIQSQIPVIDSVLAGRVMSQAPNKAVVLGEIITLIVFVALHCIINLSNCSRLATHEEL